VARRSQPTRKSPASLAGNKVRVARIGAAHGVRGEVKLWSFTEDPMAVANYGPLETEDGSRQFEIAALWPAKDFLVARIAGIDDRTAAGTLCNVDLFVPRDRLPPIEAADTYYHADLIGLSAVRQDGSAFGTVTAVHNFGAGDLIEIVPAAGGEPLLLPFTEAVVPTIDMAARKIVIVPPAVSE
jgi:16S rRNA processing protein RimM